MIKQGNEKAAKGRREVKSVQDEYKDIKHEGLKWEGKVNFGLRIVLGAGIFYAMFYIFYNYYQELDIFLQIANVMLYSTLASFIAIVISYAIVRSLAKHREGEKVTYRDVHQKMDVAHITYECLAIIFSAFFTVFGMLPFLRSMFSFGIFTIVYIIAKVGARLIAYIIGHLASHKTFVALGIVAGCVIVIFTALAPVLTVISLINNG